MKFREALKIAKKLAKQRNKTYVIWEKNTATEDFFVCLGRETPPVSSGSRITYSQLLLVTPSGTISQ